MREGHLARCSHQALALYLLLVTVADAEGLSYYSDRAVCGLLQMAAETLAGARRELCRNRLIAYQAPLYQVLALEDPQAGSALLGSARGPRGDAGEAVTIGELLRRAIGDAP